MRNRNLVGRGEFQFALGAFDGDRLAVELGGDAGRDDDGLFADTGHCSNPFAQTPRRQKTVHRTSPPTLFSRAEWSAITPFGVDTIDTPSPLATRGIASTVT